MGRFKKAVKKINSLLRFSLTKWRIINCFLKSTSGKRLQSLSFNDRLGLRGCIEDDQQYNSNELRGSSVRALQRVTSYGGASSDDDVDKRAELFISNFRRQLWFERQVSLELRYCRTRSLEFDRDQSPT